MPLFTLFVAEQFLSTLYEQCFVKTIVDLCVTVAVEKFCGQMALVQYIFVDFISFVWKGNRFGVQKNCP